MTIIGQLHGHSITITKPNPFSTIHANTPWQVLHSPPRICQRGLAGFPLAPVQRTYNERVRVYTITFLPPGRFLYSHLHLLINKISSKKRSKPNHSFSGNKPYKSFSLREKKTLSPRREWFILARRIVYLREGNEEHSHRTGQTHYKFSLFLADNQPFASRRLRRLTQNLRVASPSLPSGRYTRVNDACSA